MERKRWDALPGRQTWFHLARIPFHRGRTSRLHSHDFPEIFWVEAGEALHEINGLQKKLSQGDLVFVRATDRHRLSAADNKGFLLVNLALPAELLADLGRRHPEISALYAPSLVLPVRHRLAQAPMRRLREEAGWLAGRPGTRLAVESFLLNLCLMVLAPHRHAPATSPDWLAKACLALERPEVFARGVEAFVRACGRSAAYVCRSTRQHLGKTPTELVNSVRLAHAARELRLAERSILDIALDCGIENLAHFYRLFRRAHGTTPHRYRREHQQVAA